MAEVGPLSPFFFPPFSAAGVHVSWWLGMDLVSFLAAVAGDEQGSLHRHHLLPRWLGLGSPNQAPGVFPSFQQDRYVQLEASALDRLGMRVSLQQRRQRRRRARSDRVPARERSPIPEAFPVTLRDHSTTLY